MKEFSYIFSLICVSVEIKISLNFDYFFKFQKKRENLYLFCKTYSMYCPISKSGNKDST
jgi:hypothetical protein